jgi:threonine dehydrogenase-like Zn-dependent dehydrogenase
MIKELTFVKKNKLEWRERPEPKILRPGEAIVRPFVVSRCDADSLFLFHDYSAALRLGVNLHYLDRKTLDVFGEKPFRKPFCVGHECIAEVIEVGDGVTNVRRGQVVVVPWAISCGACHPCSTGIPSHCDGNNNDRLLSAFGFGESMGDYGGAVSDLLKVPFADAMLLTLPSDINPYHCSSLSDNIADGYRAVGPQLRSVPKAPVLVVGGSAKSIGLYAAAIAVASGSSRVDYVDYFQERLDIAKKVGANPIQVTRKMSLQSLLDALPREAYPITVDASGSEKFLNLAIRKASAGGYCTSIAFYLKQGTKLPLWDMYTKSLNFHIGVSHPRRDIPDVFPLIQSGKFRPELITTRVGEWHDGAEAYLDRSTKVILRRDRIFATV